MEKAWEGILPVKLLLSTEIDSSEDMDGMEKAWEGMLPVKLLPSTQIDFSEVSSNTLFDRVPVKLLYLKLSPVKSVSAATSSAGIGPAKLLLSVAT